MLNNYTLTELALSQWSVIIQVSILIILTFVFVALWIKFPRRSVFNWMFAWISNLSGLIIIFLAIHQKNDISLDTYQHLFALYSLFKIWYAVLLINGLWRYALAKSVSKTTLMHYLPFILVAYFFLLFFISSKVIFTQLMTFSIIGLVLLIGSLYFFIKHTNKLTKVVAFIFCIEALLFLFHAWQLSPVLWNEPPPNSMTYMSFLDSMVELIVGIICLFAIVYQVIDEQQISNQEMEFAQNALRKLVDKDPLTGLWNRRKLPEFIQKNDYHCTLVYMDINKFKSINDIWGHDMGDKCLCEIAQLMHKLLSDEVGKFRLGGDEFLLVVPEKLVNSIDTFKIKINKILSIKNATPAYSLAIGIYNLDGKKDYKDALKQADLSMYRNKKNIID